MLGNFYAKLNTHNFLCWKFAAVCGKIATFCPPSFLTLDDADNKQTTDHTLAYRKMSGYRRNRLRYRNFA